MFDKQETKSMKLLVITQYYYPEVFKITDICEELVIRGHSVTVLTGLPNYPVGKILPEYLHREKRSEMINGVNVERSFLIERGNNVTKLILNYLSFMIFASIKVLRFKEKFDIVFVYQLSPVLMAIPGLIYRKKFRTPLYLYCLDIWPESVRVILKNTNSVVYKLLNVMSQHIYQTCDYIDVSSKPFMRYMIENHRVRESKLNYLPQHGYDYFANIDKGEEFHKGINVSYFGNIGKAQDFEMIIRNLDRLESNINFHIIGDGSEFENLKNSVARISSNNRIIFHGFKQRHEIVKLYQLTDICLITLKADNSIGDTLPSKMIEYMSVNRPILAVAKGSIKEIIEEVNCGYCIDFGDDSDFIHKLNKLANDAHLRTEFGLNGRRYFDENFTKDKFVCNLESRLLQLIGGFNNV